MSFFVTATKEDKSTNFVTAKFLEEQGKLVNGPNWGKKFVGNNGVYETLNASSNANYATYLDAKGTLATDPAQNLGYLIVPENYSFGSQLVGLYVSMASFGSTAGVFNYARLMTLAGYNYDNLASAAGTLNAIRGDLPFFGNPAIDTHGDSYGNSTRAIANLSQGYNYERSIIDKDPASFRPSADQKLDFSSIYGLIDYDDGKLTGTPIQVAGFGSIVGTKNADTFRIVDDPSGKNEITYFDGAGGSGNGQDTFDVDYGQGGGSPLLLQSDGGCTFKFENPQNSSFTAVWGGTSGNNTYDFETGSSDGAVADVAVCVVQIDGLDEQSCANLDLDALKAKVSSNFSADYHEVKNPIVIINPAQSDKIELNGQIVTNPTSSIGRIDDEFKSSTQVDGQDEDDYGTISADGGPSGLPAIVGFAGTEYGYINGYYEDTTSHRVQYDWRSGPVNLDMGEVDIQQPYRMLVLGFDNNSTGAMWGSAAGPAPRSSETTTISPPTTLPVSRSPVTTIRLKWSGQTTGSRCRAALSGCKAAPAPR